ncbi:hypothetical protein AQUCO_00300098v1 [Aquilegia coerulea]|uniref:Uncharacterized protein n=1 Tax=Aquilegia coerulea TaxID=218851 RepID=A0A2G5EX72_AQUCA|nr:hypothetical protein AQUCO_00300098v1 [Aquilegia coerulea]
MPSPKKLNMPNKKRKKHRSDSGPVKKAHHLPTSRPLLFPGQCSSQPSPVTIPQREPPPDDLLTKEDIVVETPNLQSVESNEATVSASQPASATRLSLEEVSTSIYKRDNSTSMPLWVHSMAIQLARKFGVTEE